MKLYCNLVVNLNINLGTTILLLLSNIIDLVERVIENTQQKIPALERSIQEIRQEWKSS